MKANEKRIMAEAAAWVEWAERPIAAAEDAAAFERWMGQSEVHRTAFADLAALWRSDALGEAVELSGGGSPVQARPRLSWGLLASAGVAAAAVVVGLFAPLAEHRTIESGRAERRTVELADGTSVQLNGGARLRVRQGVMTRVAALERGEAYFDVRHDRRAFTVTTDEGRVQVTGTAFNVDRTASGRTEVALYRGAVRLRGRDRSMMDMRPGDRAVLEQGRLRRVAASAMSAPDWLDGWFDAEDASLGRLVEELDRFSATPVLVEAPASRIRVSGRFHVADPASVLELIQVAYGVQVKQESDRIRIISHSPE